MPFVSWLFFYDTLINSASVVFICTCLFFGIKKIENSLLRKFIWLVYYFFVILLGGYAWDSALYFYNLATHIGFYPWLKICIMFDECIFVDILPRITALFSAFLIYFILHRFIKKNNLLECQVFISILLFIIMGIIVNHFLYPYFVSQSHF